MAKFKIAHITEDVGTYGISTGLTGGLTSLTGNQIQPRVKIGSAANAAGSILAAKGSRKFQVTDGGNIQDEDIVAGNTYIIKTLSGTDWSKLGVQGVPAVGAIFTAKINGTDAGFTPDNGVVSAVATCTLVNKANGSLAAGEMNILCTKADTTTFYAKRITNKYVMDFSDNKYLVGSTATTATAPDTVAVARA
jgi:hypothetical protein